MTDDCSVNKVELNKVTRHGVREITGAVWMRRLC